MGAREKRAMLVEISERVENAADNLFKTIQGSHKQIADNYLSLKAYAVTAGGKLKEYVIKGKGKNLSSLGDLLSTIAGLSHVKAVKAEGVGAGGKTIPAIFTSRKVKVDSSVTKINVPQWPCCGSLQQAQRLRVAHCFPRWQEAQPGRQE